MPGDPIQELRSTKLHRYLSGLDPAYARRAEVFLEAVVPLLASTVRHFPYYTRHDAHHGFRVIKRIEQVVQPACFDTEAAQGLSAPEVYLLILSAYAHDLGMTVFPDEADHLLGQLGLSKEDSWEIHPALQAHLRQEHSRRGGTYILTQAEALGVPRNLIDPLDRMMQAHNLSVGELEAKISSCFAAGERPIDVRQLSLILCVADALEFSDTRVVEGVLDALAEDDSPAAKVSWLENMKHVCVGDSLAIDRDGRVVVSGTFDDEAVLALAHHTLDQMESWIAGYCDVDRRSQTLRLAVRPEPFLRNLAFPAGRFERLGVRLNKRNVIDLIASNAVWSQNAGLAVRELLQNAVEACRYRRHHSSRADAYLPEVRVTIERQARTLTIQDNGCGMSDRVVLNNLLTVGSSRAVEASYATAAYAPIARFGVGFWSVFTIAQVARIVTAPFEPYRGNPAGAKAAAGFSFTVSLRDLHDYSVFRPETAPCGTTIRLDLLDQISVDELYDAARTLILCSEIPVHIELDGEGFDVPLALPNVPDSQVLGSRGRIIDDHDIRLFKWSGSKGDTDLSLALAYRMKDNKPTFLLASGGSVMTALPRLMHPKSAICGFTVPLRLAHLTFDLNRVGTFFANRRTPAGIAYSLDRRRLLDNEASVSFAEEVTDLIHDGYRAFLDHTRGHDLKTVAALRTQAAMHGGNVYDVFTEDELVQAARRFPDLAPIKLYPLEGDSNGQPIFVDPNGLAELSGQVVFLQRSSPDVAGGWRDLEGDKGVDLLRSVLGAFPEPERPAYVMETDRAASWLFDNDPDGEPLSLPMPGIVLPLLAFRLERVSTDRAPEVLARLRGVWSGAVYLRAFHQANDCPYRFLGRHRVLIASGSALADHLTQLASEGRLAKMAELVHDLREDEAGYTPSSVAALLPESTSE